MFALEQGKWHTTVKVVADGGRGIGLMVTIRRSGKVEQGKHIPSKVVSGEAQLSARWDDPWGHRRDWRRRRMGSCG